MDKKREKVEKEISKILSAIMIQIEPMASIVRVSLSDKIGHANVFISFMGSEGEKKFKKLQKSAPFFRSELAKKLNKRYVPTLHFKYDTSLEYSQQMSNILNNLQGGEK